MGIIYSEILSLIYFLLAPLLYFRLHFKNFKHKFLINPRKLIQILGIEKPQLENAIWLHAVSVGEVLAIQPLIQALKEKYPQYPLFITTTTLTAAKVCRDVYSDIDHSIFPLDISLIWHYWFFRSKPKLLILVEKEIWPNLLKISSKKKIPSLLVNARLNQQSFNRWKRYFPIIGQSYSYLDWILAHSVDDQQRFKNLLGCKASANIKYIGNMKFDHVDSSCEMGGRQIATKNIILAASSHSGEEEIIINAYIKLISRLKENLPTLVIVPRHPERSNSIKELVKSMGLSVQLKSKIVDHELKYQVFIVDSLGSLQYWYAQAKVAIISGSLLPYGGHNPIEAIVHGDSSLICGHHYFNFGFEFCLD